MRVTSSWFIRAAARSLLVVALIAGSLTIPARTASAQASPVALVRDLLVTHSVQLREDGFHLVRQYFTDRLDSGDAQNVTVTLYANVTYALIGVCDEDCDDLDFRLFNDNGLEVGSDLASDDTPIVTITPARTQTYTLRVVMASCGVNPCWFGVGVYSR